MVEIESADTIQRKIILKIITKYFANSKTKRIFEMSKRYTDWAVSQERIKN